MTGQVDETHTQQNARAAISRADVTKVVFEEEVATATIFPIPQNKRARTYEQRIPAAPYSRQGIHQGFLVALTTYRLVEAVDHAALKKSDDCRCSALLYHSPVHHFQRSLLS